MTRECWLPWYTMMSNTANSVREVILVSVPRATYADPTVTAQTGKQVWSARFNVACWLRLQYAVQSPIRLKILFRDSRGWQQVFVDEGFINAHNRILLSGAAEVRALGPILEMKVTAAGISPSMKMSAEELFVQKIDATEQQQHSSAEAA